MTRRKSGRRRAGHIFIENVRLCVCVYVWRSLSKNLVTMSPTMMVDIGDLWVSCLKLKRKTELWRIALRHSEIVMCWSWRLLVISTSSLMSLILTTPPLFRRCDKHIYQTCANIRVSLNFTISESWPWQTNAFSLLPVRLPWSSW